MPFSSFVAYDLRGSTSRRQYLTANDIEGIIADHLTSNDFCRMRHGLAFQVGKCIVHLVGCEAEIPNGFTFAAPDAPALWPIGEPLKPLLDTSRIGPQHGIVRFVNFADNSLVSHDCLNDRFNVAGTWLWKRYCRSREPPIGGVEFRIFCPALL
jgi:hypothetical protein